MSERSMHKIDQTAQAVAPRRELVRRLLEQKEPITHEEISAYVDGVMENIQRFDDPQAKAVFLMQDLQADLVLQDAATMPMYKGKIRAIMNFFREIVDNSEEPTKRTVLDKALEGKPGKEPRLTREDMEAVLQPIRRAVIEELKKRLTQDQSLGHINYSDVQFILGALQGHKLLSRTKEISGKQNILREDRGFFEGKEKGFHQEAIRQLIALLPQDHILPLKGFDPVQYETLTLEEELSDLSELLDEKEKDPIGCFSILLDCMKGARTLEKHGLVLQDIKPDNIGYVMRDKNKDGHSRKIGVLFDLEGIYLAGKPLDFRFGYKEDKRHFAPEFRVGNEDRVSSSEMVYQFGLCLEYALNELRFQVPTKIHREIILLYTDMMAYDLAESSDPLHHRIGLVEAMGRLRGIIDELSVSQEAREVA